MLGGVNISMDSISSNRFNELKPTLLNKVRHQTEERWELKCLIVSFITILHWYSTDSTECSCSSLFCSLHLTNATAVKSMTNVLHHTTWCTRSSSFHKCFSVEIRRALGSPSPTPHLGIYTSFHQVRHQTTVWSGWVELLPGTWFALLAEESSTGCLWPKSALTLMILFVPMQNPQNYDEKWCRSEFWIHTSCTHSSCNCVRTRTHTHTHRLTHSKLKQCSI